jgi:hypothetical protein
MQNTKTYRDYRACERRYPRLIRAMCWVACLSMGEAACALRDLRHYPDAMGGEAVCHFGGPEQAVKSAIQARHTFNRLRKLYANERETQPLRRAA